MDDFLPSYDSAVKQDPWELVARYCASDELCNASLVCQRWAEIFTERLWGNPSSHFGVQNDTVYVALTRFKRTLHWARLRVRELTHTLHLPPAHAEIYGGPHSEWLRDCLERLPRLQCLIVNGLPFFDHASLLTLRSSSIWWQQTHLNLFPVFGLRLLDASGCFNVTSTGLAEALRHIPDLVSLDLSNTIAARDEVVLGRLKSLPNLRILKISGLGLKDADFSIVVSAIGVRVRSLDASDNNLTDDSIRLLLEHCLKGASHESHGTRSPLPPVRHGRPAGEVETFATEDLDGHMRRKLTQGYFGSLAIEEARDVGITHLYLSNNSLSVEGISGLLRSARLQVLDIGTLAAGLQNPPHSPSKEENDLLSGGVERLTPLLAEFASKKLVYLRVNYTIVTEDCPTHTSQSQRAELSGDFGAYAPASASELPVSEPITPELDTSNNGVYELPGDILQPIELPAASSATSHTTPSIKVIPEPMEIKRGPAYAPEPVIVQDSPLAPPSTIADAFIYTSAERGNKSPTESAHEETTGRSRHNSIHYVEEKRARLDLRQSRDNRLHPGMLPRVHTLVLTGVPAKTDDYELINRLIQFIKDCAEEVEIATLRARHTYMLPPGRLRKNAEREYARSLFALHNIVLEVAPVQAIQVPKRITTSWRAYPTKSSTEDADSETFWDAAAHDFSFFGDEECGLPNTEPGRGPPLAAMSGLILAPKRIAPPSKPQELELVVKPVFDVVSEIGQFRRERKAAFNAALQAGATEPSIEGYWPGAITVVKKSVDPNEGSLDYYGNRFESGWLYR